MSAAGAAARIEARVAGTGLLPQAAPVVVLLSGGRDSVCLLDLAVRLSGARAVSALHVNYGLRDTATDDEEFCSGLCAGLAVPLEVRRPRRPEGRGNLQAWARDQRHAAAAQIALSRRARVATGHTSTDQVETLLYRLAASPGRRALLGMRERDGRLVRPCSGCRATIRLRTTVLAGSPWRDDPTNDSDAFARNRVRHGLLEALKTIHPAAEANLLATLAVLRDESDVLESVVDSALTAAGHDARGAGADVAGLRALAPALRRLAVQKLADEAQGGRAPAVGRRTDEILQLAAHGGSGSLDLGGGGAGGRRVRAPALHGGRGGRP
jgi:tRNA(Ile)-lysidine synthase